MDAVYISVAQADAYHAIRMSHATWAALSESDKAARLVSASDYLDGYYRFRGKKTSPTQLRQFPRNGETTIPPEVMQAVLELAVALPSSGGINAQAARTRKRVKVGEIETEYQDATAAEKRLYPLIDGLLRDWIIPDGVKTGAITVGSYERGI